MTIDLNDILSSDIISEDEKNKLLYDWNNTEVAYPREKFLYHYWYEQAAKLPRNIAIHEGKINLSYESLDQLSNQLAHWLLELQCGRNQLVAVCCDLVTDQVLSMLAILKSGSAYVPLDHKLPSDRLEFILNDTQARVLITTRKLSHLFTRFQNKIIFIDDESSKLHLFTHTPVGAVNSSQDLAYVIYTSGSTGVPKGVQITHLGLMNYLNWCLNYYPIQQGVGVPLHSSFAYDMSVTSIFVPLLSGKTVFGFYQEENQLALKEIINSGFEFSFIKITPTHIRLIELFCQQVEINSSFKAIIIGGELLNKADVDVLQQLFPDSELYNEYGPTEITVACSIYKVNDYKSSFGSIPIGSPIHNMKMYILDDELKPVAIGMTGEIFVGGLGLASGYLNRNDLTAKNFIKNPFSSHAELIYKTGDLGRFIEGEDIEIEYIGRKDNQVKIRGFRIELHEIELVLQSHAAVQQAAVVLHVHDKKRQQIIAYYTTNFFERELADELKTYLAEKLPYYMLPDRIIKLDCFPLSNNGKIDRQALMLRCIDNEPNVDDLPNTSLEKELSAIVSAVLRVDEQQIKRNSNLFELGVDSIISVQILLEAAKRNINIQIQDIFDFPTIAQLAKHLEPLMNRKVEISQSIPAIKRDQPLQLSFAQQRLWFIDNIISNKAIYNVPLVIQVQGELNTTALNQAYSKIIERHEILRTVFIEKNGEVFQQIKAPPVLEIPLIDLTFVAHPEKEQLFNYHVKDQMNRAFDLNNGPLLRSVILRMGMNNYFLLITWHHIICDGWSINLFIKELSQFYNAFVNNKNVPSVQSVDQLPIQYADFSQWQRDWLEGHTLQQQFNFWKSHLSSAPELIDLYTSYKRPLESSYRGGIYRCRIEKNVYQKIKQLAEKSEATLFMVLYAAFQLLLFRLTHQENIVVGIPVANRHYHQVDSLIGLFVNVLPVCINHNDNFTFEGLLNQVKEKLIQCYQHQDIPFEYLVDNLNINRRLNYHPIFQILFVLQNVGELPIQFDQLETKKINVDVEVSKFDLTLFVEETNQGLDIGVEYSQDLFEHQTIVNYVDCYLQLLSIIPNYVQTSVTKLALLSYEQRQTILARSYPSSEDIICQTIMALIENQVTKSPNKHAIVSNSGQMTYSEFNAYANQLAHYLRGLPACNKVVIVLCLPRSCEQIVSILAILKAGFAYLPMDPDYPKDQIELMLNESGAEVVITNSQLSSQFACRSLKSIIKIDSDEDRKAISYQSTSNPLPINKSTDLAYVIYTSGSTGKPKGVLIEHRGLSNLAVFQAKHFKINNQSNVLQFAPLNFDASVSEWSTTLAAGGTLYLLPEQKDVLIEQLPKLFNEYQITVATLPPSVLKELHPNQMQTLQTLIVAGEPCSENLKALWCDKVCFINAYGPTEATVCASLQVLTANHGAQNIGLPLENVSIYILDANQQPVPMGVKGEIWIGGIGVARGYLNRASLTEQCFIRNPFAKSMAGETFNNLYRTGDIGRYLVDGSIEYLGREDNQIKLRGFRIELNEIELAVTSFEGVQQTVVLIKENDEQNKRLVCYIVTDKDQNDRQDFEERLGVYLATILPRHMMPSQFVILDRMPTLTNGKIDRQQLSIIKENEQAKSKQSSIVYPRNDIEKKLAYIWKKLLGLETIGIKDNFFQLGGDSILSIQLLAKARNEGLIFSVKQLFLNPTIESLACVVSFDQQKSEFISQQAITGDYPLSPIQHWFLSIELTNPNHFNQSFLFHAQEVIDINRLNTALKRLVTHHDSLRMRLKTNNGNYHQHYIDTESAILEDYCCEFKIDADDFEQLKHMIKEKALECITQFNIEQGPLLKALLFTNYISNPIQQYLLIIVHHLVIDMVSWPILLEDLETLYKNITLALDKDLPLKTHSHIYWLEKINQIISSGKLDKEVIYWQKKLTEINYTLPRDFHAKQNTSNTMEIFVDKLGQVDTNNLIYEAIKPYHMNVEHILIIALALTFHNWSGLKNVSFTLEKHGRDELAGETFNLSRTIGWFTSMYPLTVSINADTKDKNSLSTLLKHIKEQLIEISHHANTFGPVRYLHPKFSQQLKSISLPKIAFNYLGQIGDKNNNNSKWLEYCHENLDIDHAPQNSWPFEIVINCYMSNGELHFHWVYNTANYKKDTISDLCKTYLNFINEIAQHCCQKEKPEYTPSDFPLVPELTQNKIDQLFDSLPIITDLYPLSVMQEGLLFNYLRHLTTNFYLVVTAYELKNLHHVSHFKQAWQYIIDRHLILKAGFIWEKLERPLQYIIKNLTLEWRELDWTVFTNDKIKLQLLLLMQEEQNKVIDLVKPPLLRFTLIKIDSENYVFLWAQHHIILDGWSAALIIRDVKDIYNQLIKNNSINLPYSPSYKDFINWFIHEDLERALNFWSQNLSGFEQPTFLSEVFPQRRDKVVTVSNHRYRLFIDCVAELKQFAKKHTITVSNIIQCAWTILLAHYSGESDILFGITVSGRSIPVSGIENIVGLLSNTLPLRIQIDFNQSLIDLLMQINVVSSRINDYSYVSLSQITNAVELNGGSNGTKTLFDHIISFIEYHFDKKIGNDDGLQIEAIEGLEKTEYPLTLFITPKEQLFIEFSYQEAFFNNEQIIQLGLHFENVLRQILLNPSQAVRKVNLLGKNEIDRIFLNYNCTKTNYPCDVSIKALFENIVLNQPQSNALIHHETSLTYDELNQRANQLAHHLFTLGIRADQIVAVALPRSIDLIVTLVAILKLGSAYLYLDLDYPAERLMYLLNDSSAIALIGTDNSIDKFPEIYLPIINLDETNFSEYPSDNLDINISSSALAYIIYTSGTTGKPKGVLIEQRSIIRLVRNTNFIQITAKDCLAHASSAAFDAATLEIWGALLNGAELAIFDQKEALEQDIFSELLAKYSVTILWLTASLFNNMVNDNPNIFSKLVTLIIGGEKLSSRHIRQLFEKDKAPKKVLNGYGPTENTVFTTTYEITASNVTQEELPIGSPIANTQVYILNKHGHLAPLGVIGEITTSGDGLARGYLGDEALTAQKFRQYPFSDLAIDVPNLPERIYCTGDLGRYLPDGSIQYCGRIDKQVKLRGYRIELNEIRLAINSYEAVLDSIVISRINEESQETYLIAYITFQKSNDPNISDNTVKEKIRAFLQNKLPVYMVPRYLVIIDKLPLTKNGKLDYAKLPDPQMQDENVRAYIQPNSKLEQTLVDIWKKVLNQNNFDIHSNFFEYGGDSIKCVRIVSLAKDYGISYTINDVFKYPTIAQLIQQLALNIEEIKLNRIEPFALTSLHDREKLPLDQLEDAFPLTLLQEGMLLHTQVNNDNPVYQDTMSFTIEAPFDLDLIRTALKMMLARHAVLRTCFNLETYSKPLQLVYKRSTLECSFFDESNLSSEQRNERIQQWIETEKSRRIHFNALPIIRFAIHQFSENQFQFGFTFHHASLDGWSVASFMAEFSHVYNSLLLGNEINFDYRPLTYNHYVALEQETICNDDHINYWLNHYRNCNILKLPRLLSNKETNQSGLKKTQRVSFNDEECYQLQRIAKSLQVAPKAIFLSAHFRVLNLLSGIRDIITGMVVNTRLEMTGSEKSLGLYLTTLPLVFRLQSGSWKYLIQAVHIADHEMQAHRHFPLIEIQKILKQRELFEVMFNYVHFHAYQETEKNGFRIKEMTGYAQTNFPLAVQVFQDTQKLSFGIDLEYDSAIFTEQQLNYVAGYYKRALQSIITDISAEYLQVCLLSDEERNSVLYQWNKLSPIQPKFTSFQSLFEKQVISTPKETALICGQKKMDYSQLNCMVNKLANNVLKLLKEPQKIICVMLERDIPLACTLMAILKAGAIYIPIDPKLPITRIATILQESNCHLLVTETIYFEKAQQLMDGQSILIIEDLLQNEGDVSNPPMACHLNDLAYVIFTSGSTGKPKGAMVEHQGLSNHLLAKINDLALTDRDIVSQTASQSFDISIWQFLAVLLVGGTVVIFKDEEAWNPLKSVKLINDYGITIFETVPSQMNAMLEELENKQLSQSSHSTTAFTSLRWLMLTGEPLFADTCKRWFNLYPHIPIINAYGPTECSDDVTHYKLFANQTCDHDVIPISGTIDNMAIYILDDYLNPVPFGVIGEIYIGGIGVGRGYLSDIDKTNSSFIEDIYSNGVYPRLYKTGDLGRLWPNGEIEFLGRKDYQVKIRGYRIELSEIESVLSQHPLVSQVAVIVWQEEGRDKHLVAYIALIENAKPFDESERTSVMREFLNHKIPEYMIPAFFIFLEKLPLTSNGKLDRNSLPLPNRDHLRALGGAKPKTELEKQIALIWSELLRIDNLGVDDNFFSLGGHSLLATQVAIRLRQKLNYEFPLRYLFDYPTLKELASKITLFISDERKFDKTQSIPPLYPMPRDNYTPVSYAQQRLWFLDQFLVNKAIYNIPIALRLTGLLDVSALHYAFEMILARHEILRSGIINFENQAVLVAEEKCEFLLEKVDFSCVPPDNKNKQLTDYMNAQIIKPFDLSQGPLLRGNLIYLDKDEHVLLITIHHIISDGWSNTLLLHEISEFYSSYKLAKSANLPQLPVQYADFSIWQRSWLTGPVIEKQLTYWKEQLKSIEVLQLPTDRVRPKEPTYSGKIHRKYLTKEVVTKLKHLGEARGCTLFMTLLTAFNIFLHRYTRQDDIIVGSPIANRHYPEVAGLIGFFVNTIVLRTDCANNPSFEQLLEKVKKITLEAYEHQDLPFERLVDHLQLERDLSRHPVFQVMFALQDAAVLEPTFANMKAENIMIDLPIAKFDLTLAAQEINSGLVLWFEYAEELFEDTTIQRMAENFSQLIESIILNPHMPIEQLELLTATERFQLLTEWNSTTRRLSENICIHQLFEEQVRKTPNDLAVIFNNEQMTYHQLNSKANQLAHYLKANGVDREILVGLCMERCIEMIVAILAILKSGGAYVPLDPDYPDERLKYISYDIQASIILTQSTLVSRLNSLLKNTTHVRKIFAVDLEQKEISSQSIDNPSLVTGPDDACYVIYTSGSTGKPKGVCISHAALCNRILWMQHEYKLMPSDRVLQKTPFSFDVSVWEFLWPLVTGSQLIIAAPGIHRNPDELVELIKSKKVTVIHFVPSMLRAFLQTKQVDGCQSLRYVFASGESLSYEMQQFFYKTLSTTLINLYGPTEAAIDVTFWRCQSDSNLSIVPIGKPIANTQIYILDNHLNLMPIGAIGELHIGGIGLARGYLNQPQLTREKFIDNPFVSSEEKSQASNLCLYRTGDLARFLTDGNIQYLGRIDNQIKLRGYRIELGEIEALLNAYPGIKEAVVNLQEKEGDVRLIAYLISSENEVDLSVIAQTNKKINQYLTNILPDYMIPSAWVWLEKFPLTTSGKLDRKALPAPDLNQRISENYNGPRNLIEEQLVTLWSQCLHVDKVSINDNFFLIGGYSLLAIKLIAEIRQTFGIELPLRCLFESPTISTLAERILEAQQQQAQYFKEIIPPVSRNQEIPLSLSQQRLWFLHQLLPNKSIYNIPLAMKLMGDLDINRLRQCLDHILMRHEILRTNFIEVEGRPRQIINPSSGFNLTLINLRDILPNEQQHKLNHEIACLSEEPFDLENGSLIRGYLFLLRQDSYVLLFCMHHIIFDQWAIGLFIRELNLLYNNGDPNELEHLAKLPIQYADFSIWQRQWLNDCVLRQQLEYWEKQLSDIPALSTLNPDFDRPKKLIYKGGIYRCFISAPLSDELKNFSGKRNVTLFMTLLTVFQLLLHRYTGQDDIVVGTPIANRHYPGVENLIGFFSNTLALRTNFEGNPSFEQVLKNVRSMALAAYDHQDISFEQIVDHLKINRDLGSHPIFQVLFELQNNTLSNIEFKDIRMEYIDTELEFSKFDLTVSAFEGNQGIALRFEYASELFKEETIVRLAQHYIHFIEEILNNPDQLIGNISMLTDNEEKLLEKWSIEENETRK